MSAYGRNVLRDRGHGCPRPFGCVMLRRLYTNAQLYIVPENGAYTGGLNVAFIHWPFYRDFVRNFSLASFFV